MHQLVLGCRFLAHSYQGIRITSEGREELEWPPSPGRLHQALMAAALTRLPLREKRALAASALEALRWLEWQPAPEIIASKLDEGERGAARLRIAIPQNSPSKKGLDSRATLLAPLRRAVPGSRAPLEVSYSWFSEGLDFSEQAKKQFSALAELVAQLRYLGRAEDQIEAVLTWKPRDSEAGISENCERWQPVDGAGDIELATPRRHTTKDLEALFERRLIEARTRKSLARRYLRPQGYARDAVLGLLPVHISIFQLFADSENPDEAVFACDPENAHYWRSEIRGTAVRIAKEKQRWDDPLLATELITGHSPESGHPTEQPHLAFVPLPSLSRHGKADGRVRRFALLGFAESEKMVAAAAIYRVLATSLDGEQLAVGQRSLRLRRVEGRSDMDKMWAQFASASCVWCSATPVAIARGFKVPKRSTDGSRTLTSNERHVRRLQELEALVRASFRHVRLPDDLAATCVITLMASPFLPATHRAEVYRVPRDAAVLIHARLEFSRPVRGPLLVGDRRYFGFGLFIPSA